MNRILLTCVGLACAAAARADSVDLTCIRDNTLYEDGSGNLSNGAGIHFFAGATLSPRLRRGLIRFDVAGAVPPGSTISSATLILNLSKSVSDNNPTSLFRALKDWGEGTSDSGDPGGRGAPSTQGDATWLHTFYATSFWGTPGGSPSGASPDYAATASATIPVDTTLGQYTWGSTPGMIADAQAWLDSPAANFGWFVIGEEANPGSAKRFDTREHPTPANRPVLHLIFTPPPPPCYANCDHSTTAPCLNVLDFSCFLNAFAAGQTYANCDNSTTPPVLNVLDFSCFLNRFAAGCSNC